LGEPLRAQKNSSTFKSAAVFLWLASGYSLHHPHGVRFAHLLAGGSAAIPLAGKKREHPK
jgi:hypothetical protein